MTRRAKCKYHTIILGTSRCTWKPIDTVYPSYIEAQPIVSTVVCDKCKACEESKDS